MAWGWGGWLVGGLGADPHEERPVGREEGRFGPGGAHDVVGGLLREHVVEVVAVGVVPDRVAVLVQVVAQEVAGHRVPLIPPWRDVVGVVTV